jgi:hypothetical protein
MTIAKSSSFSNHFNHICIIIPSRRYPHHLHTHHYVIIKMIMKSPHEFFSLMDVIKMKYNQSNNDFACLRL